MLGLLNKSWALLAVLQWKCVLGISCPCPWFRPQSSTANLFGFNQSSPWLMMIFLFLFLTCLLSDIFLFFPPSCPCQLDTFYPVLFIPSHSFVLSTNLSLFPSLCFCHLNANVIAAFWKCCTQELGWPSHLSHISFTWASTIEISGEWAAGSAIHRGKNRTRYPCLTLPGLYEKAVDVTMALMNRLLSSRAWVNNSWTKSSESKQEWWQITGQVASDKCICES